MQLIQLERDDWNFFCPASGERVFKESGEPSASTIRGSWCDAVPEEPLVINQELQPLWEDHLAQLEEADEGPDVSVFLKGLDWPGWVAFEITSYGIACGPVCKTTWTVLDLS